MFFATVCSIIFGGGMPGFSLFFGEMINGLGASTDGDYDLFKKNALFMVVLGAIMWIMSWL